MGGHKEVRFRQVSLYICMHNNAICNNSIRTRKNSLTPPLYFEVAVPNCTKSGQWAVTYLCVRGIDFASFCDFSIVFWNCSDSVVFCGFFSFLYWIEDQCDICSFSFYFQIYHKMYNGQCTCSRQINIIEILKFITMDRLDVYMFAMETILYYEICQHLVAVAAKIAFNILVLHNIYANFPFQFVSW